MKERTEKEGSHPMLSPTPPTRVKKGKIISAEESVRLIRDGDTVATGGFVGTGFAEDIAVKLEEQFLKTGRPMGLTLIYAAGQYYSDVTRYTTSTFLRMKLGGALQQRGVKPHIYESREEAHKALKKE